MPGVAVLESPALAPAGTDTARRSHVACELSGGLGGPFQPPAFVCVAQRLWEAVGAIPDTMRRGGRRAMHLVRPSIGERLQQLSVQKPLACAGWEHKCWTKGSAPLLYVQI